MNKRTTHWNHINHSEDAVFEIEESAGEDGNPHRIDVFLPEITDETKPIARIKQLNIQLSMQPENWLQETGFDSRTGQIAVHMKEKTD
jgi:hypothetical protein